LAFVAMEDLDVIVLEAGLGGEFDATNVCFKSLSVITPIGLDHQAFLGDTIEAIATTKMNSIDKAFVLALQAYDEVYGVAEKIVKEKEAKCYSILNFKEKFPQEYAEVKRVTQKLAWSEYLFENTLLALYALKKVNLDYAINNLEKVKLFGRFHRILPNVIMDVGAKAISQTLEKEKIKPILVYNTLEDKDYIKILQTFKPHIQSVEIIAIKTHRALDKNLLENALKTLDINYENFKKIDAGKTYLVFGSFYVVEAFLNNKNET